MNALIVLAHPETDSFNAALARQAEGIFQSQGHAVQIFDLYADGFDPSEHGRHYAHRKDRGRFSAQTEQRFNADRGTLPPDVQHQIEGLLWADFVLFQFPLWWFGMPAMLKGWMDRVFVYGSLYTGSRRFNSGVCRGKRAMLSVTAGSSEDACAHDGREGDTRLILWPIHYALHYIGLTVLDPILLTGIGEAHGDCDRRAHDQRMQVQLQRHADRLADFENAALIRFNSEDDWDERRKLKANAPVYSPFIRHESDLQMLKASRRPK